MRWNHKIAYSPYGMTASFPEKTNVLPKRLKDLEKTATMYSSKIILRYSLVEGLRLRRQALHLVVVMSSLFQC